MQQVKQPGSPFPREHNRVHIITMLLGNHGNALHCGDGEVESVVDALGNKLAYE